LASAPFGNECSRKPRGWVATRERHQAADVEEVVCQKAFVISLSLWVAACGSDDSTQFGGTGGDSGAGGSAGFAGGGGSPAGGAAGIGGAAGSAAGGSGATAGGGGGTAGSGGASSGLLITEIMVNPKSVSDELGEYVEIFNAGSASVNLKSYKLYDGFNNNHVINSDVEVAPGAYVVLARDGNVKTNGGVTANYVYSDFFLSNTADAVLLDDPNGQLVAQVKYDDKGAWPLTDGVALELSDLALDPTLPASWSQAQNRFGTGDLGTPGGPNGYGTTPYGLDASDLGWQDPTLKASLFFSYFDKPEKAILKALGTATQSVHIAMFNLRETSIINALGALKGQGVDVQILLDKKQMDLSYNQAKVQEMINAGLPPLGIDNTNATDATMHDKFTIIDGKRVLTGSMNYSSNALNLSDEELLLIDNASVAQLFETEFSELKAGTTSTQTASTSPPIEVKFGNEDKLYDVVAKELKAAKTSAYVAMFSINNQTVLNELLAAKQRGVHVVVILDKVQADAGTEDEQLNQAQIPVFRFENKRGSAGNTGLTELHNKLCVIDGKKVLMGSYNWTNLASYHNDENMVLLTSERLATRAHQEMAQLLNDYLPTFKPGDAGFATGSRDVSFTVRGLNVDAGAEARLVGSIDALGTNNYALSIPLVLGSDGAWHKTVSLPAGTTFSYEVIVRSKVSHNYADSAGSAKFTVPYASGPALVEQAFGKRLD